MRDIKFRGKIIDGDWVYGLLTRENGNLYMSNSVGRPYAYMLRPETVGQYTGLKDKSGREIYEGDILSDVWGNKGVVSWSEEFARFEKIGGCEYAEVIGNIYENPDLIKQ